MGHRLDYPCGPRSRRLSKNQRLLSILFDFLTTKSGCSLISAGVRLLLRFKEIRLFAQRRWFKNISRYVRRLSIAWSRDHFGTKFRENFQQILPIRLQAISFRTQIFWFQNLLGAEGTNLQWRLIASHVITRLSRDPISHKSEIGSAQNTSGTYILSELFQVLGYFAVNNPENQVSLRSESVLRIKVISRNFHGIRVS